MKWTGEYGMKDKERKKSQKEKQENIEQIHMEMYYLAIKVGGKNEKS